MVQHSSDNKFIEWIEQHPVWVGVLVNIVIALLGKEFLGWNVFFLILFLGSLITTVYVFKAQGEGLIETDAGESLYCRDKYSLRTRWISIGITVLLAIITIALFICPFVFRDNELNRDKVVTVKVDDRPPTYPDPAGIINPPVQDQVDQPPVIPAEDVNLRYRNISGVELKLLVYDWYYHYHPLHEPLAPKTGWRDFEFSSSGSWRTFSDFTRSTGHYTFYVREKETDNCYQLKTKNIFDSQWPTLTIKSTGDKKRPYAIEFGSEDQP